MSTSDFPFQPAVALAPLEGLTSPPLRDLLARRGGIGVVCTEFVRVYQSPSVTRLREAIRRSPGIPLSVQLMGNDVTHMADATRLLASAGADVIDINLGCPTRRAVRGNVGAGLLRNLELLRRVLDAMRRSTAGLLSAKLRAGFERLEEACALGHVVEAAGVDYLVVHPRRRIDLYRGVADWRIVAELKRALRIPVIGNGDLWYAADAIRLRQQSGCDGVMIGRPALRNPWIFQQLAALRAGTSPATPSGADLVSHLEALVELFATTLPPHRRVGALKEHLRYLGRAIRDNGAFAHVALRLATTQEIVTLAQRQLALRSGVELDLAATPDQPLERTPDSLPSRP